MSKEKFLTGIDAGTFVGRCSIFDIEGREKSNSYKEWSYTYPPDVPGAVEFDPNVENPLFLCT